MSDPRPSSHVRGIYVMRYLLFSGGLAVACGVAEKGLTGRTPVLGLLTGLAVGLLAFRRFLRART